MGVVSKIARQLTKKVVKKSDPKIKQTDKILNNRHGDLTNEELIAGYVNTGFDSSKGVGRDELVSRFKTNKKLKEKSIDSLKKLGALDKDKETVPVYRLVLVRGGKEIKPEKEISASLSPDALVRNIDYFTGQSFDEGVGISKKGMFDNAYVVKYDVPKEKIIGYLPAFKDDIKRKVNKKLNEKGFGQEDIRGLKKIGDQSKHAKQLLDTQDEVIADVSDLKMQVMSDLKGQQKAIEQTGNLNQAIVKIAKGEIKTLEDLNNHIFPNHFLIDPMAEGASMELEQKARQEFLDYHKKYFNKMNKGGVTMKKQMEMFDEGGLEQDGGTVDPVSGNDVPVGSTQEEVRDDIPAQLSEGEFVFPADVVRFIGLNNLMQIRQEAKAGLKKMEAMGQMGNSDEATIPDDIPFTADDITVEDDDGNEGDLEMQVGGVVPSNQGVYFQPSQVGSQFNIAPQQQQQMYQPPMYQPMPQQQTGYGPSFGMQPQQPQQYTSFDNLLPKTQAYENVEYINSTTGETMVIPHVDGKPIYPPPAGFKVKPTEQVKPEEPKAEEVTVPTTQVVEAKESDDRNENQNRLQSTKSLLGTTSTLGVAEGLKGLASNKFGQAGLALLTGGITPAILALTGIPQKVADTIIGKAKSGEALTEDEQLQADALANRMSQLGSKTGRAVGQSAEAKNLSNRLGGMFVSGKVGLGVGDIDPVTGGIFNQAGQAVDPKTNENLTSYRSFKDAKVSMMAGAKAGWFGGEISNSTYMGLGEEGKKRYSDYVKNMAEQGVTIAAEGRGGSGTGGDKFKIATEGSKIVTDESKILDANKEAEKRSNIEAAAKQEAERKVQQTIAENKALANRKKLETEQRAKEAAKTRQQRLADEEERDRRQRERDKAQAAREKRNEDKEKQAEVAKQKREGGRGYVRAKGGLIEKPKKTMKRGGLASKK